IFAVVFAVLVVFSYAEEEKKPDVQGRQLLGGHPGVGLEAHPGVGLGGHLGVGLGGHGSYGTGRDTAMVVTDQSQYGQGAYKPW
ncbi:hypothetical protein TNCT_182961, partial [Trichonephila clavata]